MIKNLQLKGFIVAFFILTFAEVFCQLNINPQTIGTSYYDLQTNNSMMRRVVLDNQDNVHFMWTRRAIPNATSSKLGYNMFDANTSSFLPYPVASTDSIKSWWPNIGYTSTGNLFSVCNHSPTGPSYVTKNPITQTWDKFIIGSVLNTNDAFLPRMATTNDDIHVIISEQGNYAGVYGGLKYIRSLDDGTTWEYMGPLEDDYSLTLPKIRADTYYIDAKDSVVAVVTGSPNTQIVLYKSIDYGASFNKTIIATNSNPLWEVYYENYFNFSTNTLPHLGTNGGVTAIIDHNNLVHVVYPTSIIFSDLDNPSQNQIWEYFLFHSNALSYWNENLDAAEIIGKSIMADDNQNGILGSSLNNGSFSPHNFSNINHPSIGIDSDNQIYVAYATLIEEAWQPETLALCNNTCIEQVQFEAHLYNDIKMLKLANDGSIWEGPVNITNSSEVDELYPSIQRDIEDEIWLVYQSDSLTGGYVKGTQQNILEVELKAVAINPADINNANAIQDSEPYIIEIPLYQPISVAQNCATLSNTFITDLLFAFDYPDGIINDIQSTANIDYSIPGFYTDTLVAYDSNGNASDPYPIEIEVLTDTEAPTLTIPLDCDVINIVEGTPWQDPILEIYDNSFCDLSNQVSVIGQVDVNTIGTYSLEYSVTDFSGNTSTSVIVDVNVIADDITGPVITIITAPDTVEVFSAVDVLDYLVSDAVDCEDLIEVTLTGFDAIDNTILGSYPVSIEATDASGNTTVENFNVIVTDQTAPSVTLYGPATLDCINGIFNDSVDPGIQVSDNYSDVADITIYIDYSVVDCSTIGTYTIEYIVTDEAGNTAIATRLVTVNPTNINESYFSLQIVPNPNKGKFEINLNSNHIENIEIFDLNGKEISFDYTSNGENSIVKLDEVFTGICIIKIYHEQYGLLVRRFVVGE